MTAVTINSWIYSFFFFFNSVLMPNVRKRSRFAKFGSKDSIARVAHYFFRGLFRNEMLWRSLIGNIRSRSYWHTATGERIAYV